jgi:hypothetical protein
MADWTDQVADVIDNAVGTVRDKTVVPARKLVRAITGGLLAGILGGAAAIFAALAGFRGLVLLVQDEVWAAHLILGGIFTLAGLFCLSRR